MPIFSYACPVHSCDGWGKEVEVMKSVIQIDTPEHCPVCGAEMQRQVAVTSPPQFKGPNWAGKGKRGY